MLERIHDLPDELIGVRATGKETREDCEEVVVPALAEIQRFEWDALDDAIRWAGAGQAAAHQAAS